MTFTQRTSVIDLTVHDNPGRVLVMKGRRAKARSGGVQRIRIESWTSRNAPEIRPRAVEASHVSPRTSGRILAEYEALQAELRRVRGDEAAEDFAFGPIHDFIMRFGPLALALLNFAVTTGPLPYSARYYHAYLLGHMNHPSTFRLRLEYLRNYERSDDEALRAGALEAFDYLSRL